MRNKVDLIGYYGSDKTHALSAWTSTMDEEEQTLPFDILERIEYLFGLEEKKRARKTPELLSYLATYNHTTPFEKSLFHFRLLVDDATHKHFLKHRIGVSINGESARYKEIKRNNVYLPDDWPDDLRAELQELADRSDAFYRKALAQLMLTHGKQRAKESARYAKLQCAQVHLDVSFNFRSLMHFQGLRNHKKAQREVRNIAQEMINQVWDIPKQPFIHSLRAFGFERGVLGVVRDGQ